MIIALSGYAQSGKNQAATYMRGYKQLAFADPLRKMLYKIDPRIQNTADGQFYQLRDVINREGWEKAKLNYHDTRGLLQRLGTEAGRQVLGENIWVELAIREIDVPNVVFTDCRFPNEADVIRDVFSGPIVNIVRPGVGPLDGHASENSMENYEFDYVLENNGSKAELMIKVEEMMGKLNGYAVKNN
jgi:hypothetical protein